MNYSQGYGQSTGMSTGSKIVLAIIASLGLLAITAVGMAVYNRASMTPEQRFDAEIERDSAAKEMFDPIRVNFPGEYESFRRNVLRADPSLRNREIVIKSTSNFMKSFMGRHHKDAASAPDDSVVAYVEAAAAAGDAATTSEIVCKTLTGGASEGPPPRNEDVAANTRMVKAMIEAVVAGSKTPVTHQRPTAADQAAIRNRLIARGVTDADLQLLSGPIADPASRMRGCWTFAQVMNAAKALPRDGMVRVGANMLNESH